MCGNRLVLWNRRIDERTFTCWDRCNGGFDIDESCQFAYEANNEAEFICRDVTNIEGAELNRIYPENVIRVLVGCAPCQPFSRYSSRYRKGRS